MRGRRRERPLRGRPSTRRFNFGCANEKASPESCANLGDIYSHGLGVAVDAKAASEFYARACKLGDLESCGK